MSRTYPGGLRALATDAGLSEANLHRCIRNNKIQASDLEALSRLLKVGVEVFFTEDTSEVGTQKNGHYDDVLRLREQMKFLEQRLKDKDAILAEKERLIQFLTKQSYLKHHEKN